MQVEGISINLRSVLSKPSGEEPQEGSEEATRHGPEPWSCQSGCLVDMTYKAEERRLPALAPFQEKKYIPNYAVAA